jgi:hypothetical protein
MKLRFAHLLASLALAAAVPALHASTVTFLYTAAKVGTTTVSGFGSFSYNGALTSIGLGDLTAFNFELDLSTPGAIVNPATFDYSLTPDLLFFSATVSGGAVTALSLTTGFEAADNTGTFNENQKNLIVTSLSAGGAANNNQDEVLNRTTLYDTGTITTQGPGAPTPEPSTVFLAGGAAVFLALRYRAARNAKLRS